MSALGWMCLRRDIYVLNSEVEAAGRVGWKSGQRALISYVVDDERHVDWLWDRSGPLWLNTLLQSGEWVLIGERTKAGRCSTVMGMDYI